MQPEETYKADKIFQDLGTYPLEFKISENGSIMITDVRIKGSVVEVDYRNEGFTASGNMFGTDFYFEDANGKSFFNARYRSEERVNYADNSYTVTFNYYADDEAAENPSQEISDDIKMISRIGIYNHGGNYIPDFENGVRIEIQ